MEHFTPRSRFALVLLTLIAPLAGVSAASLIDQSGTYDYSAGANAALDANVNTSNTGGSSANLNTNTQTHTQAEDRSTGSSAVSGSNTNGAVDMDAAGLGVDLTTFDRGSVDLTASADTSASNVRADADLGAFAATSLRQDENLSSLGFAADRVEVTYREPARFLGFIPSSVNVRVSAQSDGSVEVSYPWYSFLMASDRSDIDASVKSEVASYMNSSAGASWNASARAALASRIESVLRAHLASSISASSTAETSY